MRNLPNTDLTAIVNCLKKYNPEKIILFGSAARGDQQEGSDVDLLVVKKTKTKPQYRFSEVRRYLPRDMAIDAIVYTPEEFEKAKGEGWLLMEKIQQEGKVIYER